MGNIQSRLMDEAVRHVPDLTEARVVDVLRSNLHPDQPKTSVKALSVISCDVLSVFHGDELFLTERMENIERFEVINGVGCFFVSFERKSDGKHVIFARGDSRASSSMARTVKRANHFLRFGNTDFSRVGGEGGRTCPKCGKPYPRGAHSCPRCASKIKALTRLAEHARSEWKRLALSV
ncbi:MAG: zinc ribbon domain-containing protein, partial [Ruminococcaceae bacterium]|nr:zinc ribbon domain-containing protein [Oscillospiraceae bacterium]